MQLIRADSRLALDLMNENSIDSSVTDPPYALTSIVKRFGKPGAAPAKKGADGRFARVGAGFMGQKWDTGEVAHDPDFWAKVLRVLKPGAHLVAFGGTRTYHRLATAIEDAGFEIRDMVAWTYGSGFPKSHDAGEGRGTALKPAQEPMVLARKPLIGTVAANIDAFGTGAINIDSCRVPTDEVLIGSGQPPFQFGGDNHRPYFDDVVARGANPSPLGRWPANLIHDGSDEVLAAFPDASGQIADASRSSSRKTQNVYGAMTRGNRRDGEASADRRYITEGGTNFAMLPGQRRGDQGSAARFFYCAKASKADRNEGCDALPDQPGGMRSENSGQHITRRDGGDPGPVKNNHPTVKPTALMAYLCRLVTPPRGIVLDPFMGSGSTGKAAIREGFQFIGIEREEAYFRIAQARINHEVFA